MYRLQDSLIKVKGIGPKLATQLAQVGLQTIKDLLLELPLRYVDHSHISTIDQLIPNQPATIKATVVNARLFYKKGRAGRRRRQANLTATIKDQTGQVQGWWFNTPYLADKLKPGQTFFFAGQLNDRRALVQPAVEDIKAETIHTGRLVPVYSSRFDWQQGKLRRIFKEVIDHLDNPENPLDEQTIKQSAQLLPLKTTLQQLHFPESADKVIQARKRLALEELIFLMYHSQQLKQQWQEQLNAPALKIFETKNQANQAKAKAQGSVQAAQAARASAGAGAQAAQKKSSQKIKKTKKTWPDSVPVPASIPFKLTLAQLKATHEILNDLQQNRPMNRLLIGDVGSGKTVVAGLACWQVLANQKNAALVAPTQFLAQQHAQTLSQLFPDLKIELITSRTSKKFKAADLAAADTKPRPQTPTLYVGTHALLNKLNQIQPALLIYDEQHRFGVKQRSQTTNMQAQTPTQPGPAGSKSSATTKKLPAEPTPHLLTMTATPIPRSLMLTIFAHLDLSYLDEMPKGRLPVKSWLVSQNKRTDALVWLLETLRAKPSQPAKTTSSAACTLKSQTIVQDSKHIKNSQPNLALIICPFIDPSHHQAFENIAAAKQTFAEIQKFYQDYCQAQQIKMPKIALLHGKLKPIKKQQLFEKLFAQRIEILITTPVVEVGIDLPTAQTIIIENADRFGLASLHQLRGRVGRAGQQGYCLLFSQAKSQTANQRLLKFTQQTDGLKLAELDLNNRGPGDLFGVTQHGFQQLRFADWTNSDLIKQAHQLFQKLAPQYAYWRLFTARAENSTAVLAN